MRFEKRSHVLTVLITLTLLSIFAQFSLFFAQSQQSLLMDDLINSALIDNFFQPVIILPLLKYISLQIIAYCLIIAFIYSITISCSRLFKLSAYYLGIAFWLLTAAAVLSLNRYYFPHSFFADYVHHDMINMVILILSCTLLLAATGIAGFYYFCAGSYQQKCLFMIFCTVLLLFNNVYLQKHSQPQTNFYSQPNIILIGIDSLRPDFVSFFNQQAAATPHIDQFLKTGVTFNHAYTPLARTYPAWISILTAQYPKNNHARINLAYPKIIIAQHNLAKQLQQAGFATIYASDEKRFSNITQDYGFDKVIGPQMGLNDFLLGGFSDFPLTNLLLNLSISRLLFPFQYANRAASVTYEPDHFLSLLEKNMQLAQKKPLFLAIHLCITHWPFTWSAAPATDVRVDQRYQHAVQKADEQLGKLLLLLKRQHLLEHSLVVLLSDHGTTLGLPHDRLISKDLYKGNPKKLKWLTVYKLNSAPVFSTDLQHDYSLNTSYGQGTDVLSLKQYQVLLSFKGFGLSSMAEQITTPVSLVDIAQTLLTFLQLPPLPKAQGLPLFNKEFQLKRLPALRAFYLETGDSVREIEDSEIAVEKVVKQAIKLYQLDPSTGYLFVKPVAEKAVMATKQRAVVMGQWLLAHYPASFRNDFLSNISYQLPPYAVLVNINSGEWTMDFTSAFAHQAPVLRLQQQLKAFYQQEL